MSSAERERTEKTERDERAFFAAYYGEQRYHPVGWRLRMERDLRVLLAAAGPAGLGRTLSIGCGDGAFELLLAPHAESVVGVDLSPEAIAAADRARDAQGARNASFRCTSFRDLPWDERFDTIVCLAFLHHVPEAELPEFLRACHAHLVPGGRFFSQDPNARGALRAVGRVVLGGGYDRYHTPDERELDPAVLAADLQRAGFASVAVHHVDLTLIPACYVLARWPAWPLRLAALADRAFCASPLARWSSGFAAVARKSGDGLK
jgi:SAM-dependent methyltransferase